MIIVNKKNGRAGEKMEATKCEKKKKPVVRMYVCVYVCMCVCVCLYGITFLSNACLFFFVFFFFFGFILLLLND